MPARLNIERAREQYRHLLRAYRGPRLMDLDIEAWKTVEGNGEMNAITIKKNRLRNLPQDPRIEAAQTYSELVALWPTDLFGNFPEN